VHQAVSPSLGLYLRAGGLLPKGFLLPANLANVLVDLSENPPAGFEKGFFPALGFPDGLRGAKSPPDFFAKPPPGLPAPPDPPGDLRSENPREGFPA